MQTNMTEQRNRKKKNTQNEKRTDMREPTNTTGAIWGDGTNPMYTKNRDTQRNLRKLIKDRGKVVSVLADGHCLFRAVGKILHMEPGTVM